MNPNDHSPSATTNDHFQLIRFVNAQNSVYRQVCAELRQGRKVSHWMWFVFPQLRGLGSSAMAETYGITSSAEANAYLAHPILGVRLVECAALVDAVEGRSIDQIFGVVDALKFRSSITLFSEVAPDNTVFTKALQKHFAGVGDPLTLEKLKS